MLTLGFLASGCDRSAPEGERPGAPAGIVASSTSPLPATVSLVAEPAHDFGLVTQGDTLRHAFSTHNPTRAALAIETTAPVLGCSAVPVPDVLAADQRGKLEVTCRATVYGPLRASVPLRAGGRPAGELSLAAKVEPLLVFEPSLFDVSVPFGKRQEASARLRGKLARSARLAIIASPPPGIAASVLEAEDGGSEGVVLRVRGAPAGTHAGSLRFSTALAEPKEIALPYLVKVAGTLAISPTNPVLDLGAPGGTKSLVTVTSTQPGFRVERVEVVDGPFAARVRRSGAGAEIEVTVVQDRFPPGAHGANGRIRVLSNDRTAPRSEVSLFALGRPPGVRNDQIP